MKIIAIIFLLLLIVPVIVFRTWDYYLRFKELQAGKRYCKQNDLVFIKSKRYEMHTRIYFEKEGIESWVNYEVDRDGNIMWHKEDPLEKIQKKMNRGS